MSKYLYNKINQPLKNSLRKYLATRSEKLEYSGYPDYTRMQAGILFDGAFANLDIKSVEVFKPLSKQKSEKIILILNYTASAKVEYK